MPDPALGRRRASVRTQLRSFAAVGLACTAIYLACFAVLAMFMATQLANALGLLCSAVVNTAANRRLTFGITGRGRVIVHHAQGLAVFAAGLAITAAALAVLSTVEPRASTQTQIGVLIGATAAATIVRFTMLRLWVFAAGDRT